VPFLVFISPAYTINSCVVSPISGILYRLSLLSIMISRVASYYISSTRIVIRHLRTCSCFHPCFYMPHCFIHSLTCIWLSCLWTSLHYFLSQLVSSTMLFSCSLMYLVTGISLLVRRIMMLTFSLACCLLKYLHSPVAYSTGSILSHQY